MAWAFGAGSPLLDLVYSLLAIKCLVAFKFEVVGDHELKREQVEGVVVYDQDRGASTGVLDMLHWQSAL